MISVIQHPGLLAIHATKPGDRDEAQDLALDALDQGLRVTVARKSAFGASLIFSAKPLPGQGVYLGAEHGSGKHKTADAAIADGMTRFGPAFADNRG